MRIESYNHLPAQLIRLTSVSDFLIIILGDLKKNIDGPSLIFASGSRYLIMV
jgi:hypothetical protein